MARKKKHPEHVNHERWLISYADFITLLFAFFTSMYAISTVDAKKAGQLVFSTRAAFNLDFFPSDKPTLGGRGGTDATGASRTNVIGDDVETSAGKGKGGGPGKKGHGGAGTGKRGQRLDGMARKIDAVIAAMASPGGVKVTRNDDRMIISLADQMFFENGKAKFKPKALESFHQLAAALAEMRNDIRVEGHTDDEPPTRGPFGSNLELSVARAVSVVRYLNHEFAYPQELTAVAGYADARPVADNDSADGRAKNRRVDIVVFTSPQPRGAAANPQPAPVEPPAPGDISITTASPEGQNLADALKHDDHGTIEQGEAPHDAKPEPKPEPVFPSIAPEIGGKHDTAHEHEAEH